MAGEFIGITVLLTLNDGQHTQIRGLVTNVIGQELVLTNVLLPQTGLVMNEYCCRGPNIADVKIVEPDYLPPPSAPPPPRFAPPPSSTQHPTAPPMQPVVPPIPPPPLHSVPQLYPQYQQPMQPSNVPPPTRLIPQGTVYNQIHAGIGVSKPQSQPVIDDPAILSMGRKPAPALSPLTVPPAPTQPPQTALTTPTRPPRSSVPPAAEPAVRPSSGMQRKSSSHGGSLLTSNKLAVSSSSKTQPANAAAGPSTRSVHINPASQPAKPAVPPPYPETPVRGDAAADSDAFEETDDAQSTMPPTPYEERKFTGKRSRRGKAHLRKQHEPFLAPITQEEEAPKSRVVKPGMFEGAIAQAAMEKPRRRGVRGGRTSRKSKRFQDTQNGNDEDGWATEDVTDYKTREEFDFQSNLDRFDKKTVFDQIKESDMTADEERLVSFNRLPQRSANKAPAKKNYHHSENVLGTYANGSKPLADRDGWQSPQFLVDESQSSSESDTSLRGRGSGPNIESGRNSRHAMSRRSLSHRRPSTRQAGTSNAAARLSMENLHITSSSAGGSAAATVPNKRQRPQLRLASSNRPCPIVSPLQMIDVEDIAENELGLTDDMMTENAGRGIAQVAIQAFGKRISASNHNALPVVIVFAGNNKSGARAIAAGRHLKNHHVRVMVCVLGLERGEDELLANVRSQLNIFRNAGGRVARWEELQSNLRTLDAPPELIVDGLLGTHITFEDLRTDDQATVFKLVQFANKSKASVLSIDVPSGIDGMKGEVAQIEDTDEFYMRARWVVSMGAPKSGLLKAIENGLGDSWSLWVVDIGVPNMAWRKYGTRRRHGVEFAMEWVCQLFYSAERYEVER